MSRLGLRRGTFHRAPAGEAGPGQEPAGMRFRALGAEDLRKQPLVVDRGRSERFLQRAAEGHTAFGYLDPGDALVAYFWLSIPDRAPVTAPWAFPDLRFEVPVGHAYAWDCHTAEAWRGQGLYRAGLRRLRGLAAGRGAAGVSIVSERGNEASARGIAAAGFAPAFDYAVLRLGGWCTVRVGAGPWRMQRVHDVARLPVPAGPGGRARWGVGA